MTKTLIISDLHLQGSHLLNSIDQIIEIQHINQIIMMGDYFDQWNQTHMDARFIKECEFLSAWVDEKRNENLKVICLLGNHDIPYITGNLRHYSNHNLDVISKIKDTLFSIEAQVCVEVDGYMISHAGFVGEHRPLPWQCKAIKNNLSTINKLNEIEKHVGLMRGGNHESGSVVWADLSELYDHYNPDYPKQIVSHTPVKTVTQKGDLWAVDTMSLTFGYEAIGDGTLLMLEKGKIRVLETNLKEVIQRNTMNW